MSQNPWNNRSSSHYSSNPSRYNSTSSSYTPSSSHSSQSLHRAISTSIHTSQHPLTQYTPTPNCSVSPLGSQPFEHPRHGSRTYTQTAAYTRPMTTERIVSPLAHPFSTRYAPTESPVYARPSASTTTTAGMSARLTGPYDRSAETAAAYGYADGEGLVRRDAVRRGAEARATRQQGMGADFREGGVGGWERF